MLDGMPAVRVKAEPLESEQGVREQLFSRQSFLLLLLLLLLLLFLSLPPFFCPPLSQPWADNHSQAWPSECERRLVRVGGWLARKSGGRQEDEEEEKQKKSREEVVVVGSYSWGRNASGCFSGWVAGVGGGNREPELAEGDYADGAAAAPGEDGHMGIFKSDPSLSDPAL